MRSLLPGCVPPGRLPRGRLAVAGALLLAALAAVAPASARTRSYSGAAPARLPDSATLEECVSAASQEVRAVTFAGEMTALPGTARMEMRIDLLERTPEEAFFHRVSAPGLGIWRSSGAGVKTYRYLKQVTNLAAPAFYRGVVRFRWLNGHGRLIAAGEQRTRACEQTQLRAPGTAAGPSLN